MTPPKAQRTAMNLTTENFSRSMMSEKRKTKTQLEL